MFGGPDRRTLYLLPAETTATAFDEGDAVGFIEMLRVETAGAGAAVGGGGAGLLWEQCANCK